MKAWLIDAENQTVSETQISDSSDIAKAIGFDSIASEPVGREGDYLFFDEDCFLRGSAGRCRIGTSIPIAGKAVVIGAQDEGATLSDVSVDLQALNAKIEYL